MHADQYTCLQASSARLGLARSLNTLELQTPTCKIETQFRMVQCESNDAITLHLLLLHLGVGISHLDSFKLG